jgi:hypothetical protein
MGRADILIMPTGGKTAERLTADAAVMDRRGDELTADTEPGGAGSAPANRAQELRRLGHDAPHLSLQGVVGLEVVRSAVTRVRRCRLGTFRAGSVDPARDKRCSLEELVHGH